MTAVFFDYGQTLGEIDTAFLAARVGERGAYVTRERLDAALAAAWAEYDDAKARGEVAFGAWGAFMRSLLSLAGASAPGRDAAALAGELTEWLWSEQPGRNLWRRPIAGMEGLVHELSLAGVPLGIVSNSEGRLSELLAEMGLLRYFPAVADSGVLGFEKPDRRIFDHVVEALGVAPGDFVHVGDAWVADVEGALGASGRAIWVTADVGDRPLPARVRAAAGAWGIRAALREFGVPV